MLENRLLHKWLFQASNEKLSMVYSVCDETRNPLVMYLDTAYIDCSSDITHYPVGVYKVDISCQDSSTYLKTYLKCNGCLCWFPLSSDLSVKSKQ